MSLFRLLQMLVSLVLAHRRHKRSMDQLRASSTGTKAINEILTAYSAGDYSRALEIAESLKDKPQLTAEHLFFSGTMLMCLGRLDEAERRLRRNLTMARQDKVIALSYSSLGELLLEKQQYDEALECFETSLRYWPDHGSAHRNVAEVWLRRGTDPAAALKWAELAVKEDRNCDNPAASPDVQRAHDINLGENLATLAWAVAVHSHDRDQVDRLVAEATPLVRTAVNPNARTQYYCGRAYHALGDSAKSAQHFEEAARIDVHGMWGRAARNMCDGVFA